MRNTEHRLHAELPAKDPRTKLLLAKIKQEGARPDSLIEILHTAQNAYGYLSIPVMRFLSQALKLPPSRVFATVSFYHFFSLRSKGAHTCLVCTGTACYVKGARQLLKELEQGLQIHVGEVTPGGGLGLQVARCIGACGLAPVVVLDEAVMPKTNSTEVLRSVERILTAKGPDEGTDAFTKVGLKQSTDLESSQETVLR
jgi:bidirectional [NiFe] hydrogenase diaphorase subunit